MANPNYGEILTTTINNRSKKIADNVKNNNALLAHLNRKNIKYFRGGESILQELSYAENSTYTRYSGLELLNVGASTVFSSAEYSIKQASVAVVISGLEQIQNRGSEKMIDLMASRVDNAETTMKNNISADIYSDGTASGGKQIGGLQSLIADDPTTGTVGGIDRSAYTFWRNAKFDTTADGSGAATSSGATSIRNYMNSLWVQVCRGTDKPNIIIADDNFYILFEETLQDIQRIMDTRKGASGFEELMYKSIPVVLDGGYGGDAPANHMYFCNTDYLFWRPAVDRNMVAIQGDRQAVNQDAIVKLILYAGNLTMSNSFVQGVLFD